MAFQDYFMCRTQRVQIRPETDEIGKGLFSDILKKPTTKVTDELLDQIDKPQEISKNAEKSKESKERTIIDILKSDYRDEMIFMLETGMNLLIYGVGSKINFLKSLTNGLNNHPILCINGYHPGITLKIAISELTKYINGFVKNYKGHKGINLVNKFFSMQDNIEYIVKMLSLRLFDIPKIYIVIISLDAGNIKSLDVQKLISMLAKSSMIGIIATVDTLKPGAFWDDSVLDKYNFVFYQVDTFEEYHLEKSLSSPLFSMKNEREELGLSYIIKSFTKTQVEVMKVIAKFQLENPHDLGLKEKEIFDECLVPDRKTLIQLLTEVKDHKLLFERTDKDGNTFMYLKLKANILEKIVNNKLNEED